MKCWTCHYFGGFSVLQLLTARISFAKGFVCKSGSSSTSLFLIPLKFYFLYFCKICHLTLQLSTMILHLHNNQENTITNRMGRERVHQGWMFEWELILHVGSSSGNIFILRWLLFPSTTLVTARHDIMNIQITRAPIYQRPQSS